MNPEPSCRLCAAFAQSPDEPSEGVCRRHPPQTHMMLVDADDGQSAFGTFSTFPLVKADEDWCLEFIPQEKE